MNVEMMRDGDVAVTTVKEILWPVPLLYHVWVSLQYYSTTQPTHPNEHA